MADVDLARVKRNVAKMVSMDAPEADIDAYIAEEGTSVDAVRDFKPQAASTQAAPSGADAAILGALDTATFGLLDEGAGRIDSFLQGKPYDETLAAVRDQQKAASEAHPYAYGGGQIAGAVPLAIGTGGFGLAGRGAGMAIGAAEGAAGGAAYGFGSGEGGLANRLDNSWKTAAVGGAAGGAAPVVGRALGAVAKPVVEAIRARAPSIAGATPGAVKRVITGLTDDALTDPAMLAARRAELGPEARLYNAGENLRTQAETLVQRPGPQMRTINEATQTQTQGSGDRVRSGMDAAIGTLENMTKAFDDAMSVRKTKADALYGQAFRDKRPVNVGNVVAAIDTKIKPGVGTLSEDSTTGALQRIRSFLADDANQRVDLESLHAVKMELDGMIGVAKRAGDNTKTAALTDVKRDLLGAMDGANPIYKTARNEFAGDIAIEEAMKDGQSVFGRTVRADQLYKEMGAMTVAEREAFKKGARDNVANIMDNALPNLADNADAQAVWKRLMTEENKRKMEILIGQKPAQNLQAVLKREWRLSADANTILSNSATGRRQAAKALYPDPNVAPSVPVAPSAYGRLEALALGGASKIGGNAMMGRNKVLNADAARLLALPITDPAVDALMKARLRMATGQIAGDAAVRRIGTAADLLRLPGEAAAVTAQNR